LTAPAHYHDPADRTYRRALNEGAADAWKAFVVFDDAALRSEDSAIPVKYRELMAVAVALTTQCPYCLETHTKAAKKAGATKEELAESVFVATAMRAGAAITHGFMAMKFFDQES
jgi:AhpD family alkylhydroperoxidase